MDYGLLSLIGQITCMVIACAIGRFMLTSKNLIMLVALAGAFGAMVCEILYDGQGAFVLLFYTPFIYWLAIAGRNLTDQNQLQNL